MTAEIFIDETRVEGTGDGPLAGWTFAVKDNIDVAGVPTTAGCPSYAYTPTVSAPVVRRLLDAGAVDIVNFDASEAGGITEWRRAAAACALADVRMAHHEEPQIAQHLLAGVPHGTFVECFADPERDPMWQTVWANRPAIKNGMLTVSREPGFGIVLDEALVRRWRIA